MFRLLSLVYIVVFSCLLCLKPIPLIAAEPLSLETLLELDPFDWGSIHPQNVCDECTLALANKSKLKEDQICRLYLLKSISLRFLGKEKAAINDLIELLRLRPNDCQALRLRGECYATLKQYENARSDFEALIRFQPKSGIGYACLARCLEKSGDTETIKELAEKAISVDPAEPQGYLVRAAAYLKERSYQLALKDLNQCIALRYGEGTIETPRPYLIKAAILLDIFDSPKQAREDLIMARAIYPSNDLMKALFCTYYFKSGKYNLAFHLSQQLPEDRTDIISRKINCLIERLRHHEALQVSESIIRKDHQWWGGYLCRGNVFFSQEKYKEALQDYDKALDLNRNAIGPFAAKVYLLASCPDQQFRDGRAARALATKCCEGTEYQVSRYLMLMAMACAECGDFTEAVRWGKKSLEQAHSSFPYLKDYRQRLSLFEKGEPYRFAPNSRALDYLFP